MDVREKIVELLQDANNPVWRWFPNNMAMLQLSDYLIENGVTVQEWISVEDRLPEADVAVLARCFYHESWRTLVCYMSKRNAVKWYTNVAGQLVQVTHWMPLPQPTEGE